MTHHWKDTTMSITPGNTENGFHSDAIAREARANGEDPLQAVVFQALGAASSCWDNLRGAGTFESGRAKAIGDDVYRWLTEQIGSNDKAEIYKSGGRWRYRIIAPNGRIVDAPAGQTYTTAFGAKRAARRGRPGIKVATLRTVR